MSLKRHTPEHIKLASFCRSFAHPNRVAIIEKIAQKQNCVEDEILGIGEASSLTISEHLRSLKKEGFIKGQLGKSKMSFCIDWEKLDEFKMLFDELYNQVKQHQENVTCNKGKCD